jgi:hypothetical protein
MFTCSRFGYRPGQAACIAEHRRPKNVELFQRPAGLLATTMVCEALVRKFLAFHLQVVVHNTVRSSRKPLSRKSQKCTLSMPTQAYVYLATLYELTSESSCRDEDEVVCPKPKVSSFHLCSNRFDLCARAFLNNLILQSAASTRARLCTSETHATGGEMQA